MDISTIFEAFVTGIKQTTPLEFIAVVFGIASVFFSKKENIWVYPVGLVSTVIYTCISFKYHLLGEASVNVYYTIMSIYGWWLWTRKDNKKHETILHITYSSKKEWMQQLLLFFSFYIIIFYALTAAKKNFAEGAIPWADAFASATAYTGMWLMAKKKVESWIWWILTNTASIPLYFVKTLVFTSVQYVVLLVLAVAGLIEWMNREKQRRLLNVNS